MNLITTIWGFISDVMVNISPDQVESTDLWSRPPVGLRVKF